MFGGGAFADTDAAWTADSEVVGELEDMLHNGLLLGTIFAFIWNFTLSSMFQFIGFILTYLLHSSHAALLGSRAGLGVSLLQYGYDLLHAVDRALQESKTPIKPSTADQYPYGAATAPPKQHIPPAEAITRSQHLCRGLIILGWLVIAQSVLRFLFLYVRGSRIVHRARRRERAAAARAAAEAPPPETPPVTVSDTSASLGAPGLFRHVFSSLPDWGALVDRDQGSHLLNVFSHQDAVQHAAASGAGTVFFSAPDDSGTTHQVSDEQHAHVLGLTDPYSFEPRATDEEADSAYELRAVRMV